MLRDRYLWLLSALLSSLAVGLIALAWARVDHGYPENFTPVTSDAELSAFLDDRLDAARDVQFRNEAPVLVPTGLFIQSVAFSSPTSVNLTGYVWQKYPPDFAFSRGVTLPELIRSHDLQLTEKYRGRVLHGGVEHDLVGWYFDATVRKSFDYSHYPLDHLLIWLRLWPADLPDNTRIVLVPDFDAYFDIEQARFGLDQDIVTGEWEITQTFFAYRDTPYDMRFGFPPPDGASEAEIFSEFHFSLAAERKFINAFIVNLVPVLVVALLLFAALMTISGKREQSSRFGFSTSGILGTCSALLFVILLSHVHVRGLFPEAGLVYIEMFFLIMYAAIFLVALNAYLFSLESLQDRTALHWRDNLIAKVSYWPVLLWSMAVISWLKL